MGALMVKSRILIDKYYSIIRNNIVYVTSGQPIK